MDVQNIIMAIREADYEGVEEVVMTLADLKSLKLEVECLQFKLSNAERDLAIANGQLLKVQRQPKRLGDYYGITKSY